MKRAGGFVGRDVARARLRAPSPRWGAVAGLPASRAARLSGNGAARLVAPLLAGLLCSALLLAVLRNDLIRIRYGLAAAMREEKALAEEQRHLTAKLRELRDPRRLAELAARRGFVRPEKLVELSDTGAPRP